MTADDSTTLSPMQASDIAAVLAIQRACHEAPKQESAASFLAKLRSSPGTCFVARLGPATVGYLVAVPARAGQPVPLDSPTHAPPAVADALYLHDLAVDPQQRGLGVAARLVEAYLAALRGSGLARACLVAVAGTQGFWRRHGFEEAPVDADAAARLAAYGHGARYMQRDVAARGVHDAA